MTPEHHAWALRDFHHDSKVRLRCEVAHHQTCHENGTLEHIGQSEGAGIVQQLYQCRSCHAIWTEHEAFR